MSLTHLGCPSCGGALSLGEGERLLECPYCGSGCLIQVPGAVPRYLVASRIERDAAVRAGLASLRRADVAASARGLSRVQEATLCYVPFFEATAIRLGTVFVRDRVKRPPPLTDGEQGSQALDRWLDDPGEEREDTKVVEQDVLRVGPACELPELGVGRIPLAELRRGKAPVTLAPFDAVDAYSRGMVFAPTIPSERFLEETTWRVRSANDDTRYVETRLKLLYYPVWLLRYRHRGRVYELAVDGVRGTLLRGAAPSNTAAWTALAAAGLGLGAFGLGRGLPAAGSPGGVLLLAALGGAALAWLATRRLSQTTAVEIVAD